ncbi:hypothetical protein H4217_006461, partial [Coemansia sp. RSA 1939]
MSTLGKVTESAATLATAIYADPDVAHVSAEPATDQTFKRLVITQMVLENFKSYSGRQ